MEKEKKIEILEKKFSKKEDTTSGWATLTLKEKGVALESFKTKWDFTEESAKIAFIMKGYVWGMTEEVFNEFKTYVTDTQDATVKVDMSEKVKELFEYFDSEFDITLTNTTK